MLMLPLLGLCLTWLLGIVVVHLSSQASVRFSASPSKPASVHWALNTAVGWLAGAYLASVFVQTGTSLGLSLGLSAIVWTSIAAAVGLGGLIALQRQTGGLSSLKHALMAHIQSTGHVTWILLALVCAHALVSLANQISRPIFPWDAFTTWMYRAKAWVTTDTISPMANSAQWLKQAAPEGYAIYANQYPEALSVVAAYSSSLSGQWHHFAAAAPWLFAYLALALIVFGGLRSVGANKLVSSAGAYLVASLPLIDMHTGLAGYGDLWMALSAGGGLVLLLASRSASNPQLAALGLLTLLISTQFKLEGWLWLGLGVVFLGVSVIARRLGVLITIGMLAAAPTLAYLLNVEYVRLGALGVWGLAEGQIHIGPLGSYATRPYNPMINYWNALIVDRNFHFLGVLYTLSLIGLSITARRRSLEHWLMAVLIVGAQAIIFGVSIFSEYAETGTAINRVLLQFAPVFAFTSAYSLHMLLKQNNVPARNSSTRAVSGSFAWALGASAAALLALLPLADADRATLGAENFSAVLGDFFIEGESLVVAPNSSLTVMKASSMPLTQDHNRAIVNSRGAGAFYWIEADAPKSVVSVPLNADGHTLIDLAQHEAWNPRTIVELGVIAAAGQNTPFELESVSLGSHLSWADLPALTESWRKRPEVTQVTLNSIKAPPAWQPSLVTVSAASAALLCLFVVVSIRLQRKWPLWAGQLTTINGALLLLWVINDVIWTIGYANSTLAATSAHPTTPLEQVSTGLHLEETAVSIGESLTADTPIIVAPASANDAFAAQKLPMLLLPRRVVFVNSAPSIIPAKWQGHVIVVGSDATQIASATQKVASRLKARRNGREIIRGNNYALVR